jgi:hypothetical protein
MLRRMSAERQRLDEKAAQLPEAIARFTHEANERHTRELLAELEAVDAKIRDRSRQN